MCTDFVGCMNYLNFHGRVRDKYKQVICLYIGSLGIHLILCTVHEVRAAPHVQAEVKTIH